MTYVAVTDYVVLSFALTHSPPICSYQTLLQISLDRALMVPILRWRQDYVRACQAVKAYLT